MKRFKISGFFIGFFLLLPAMGYALEAVCLLLGLAVHELGHIFLAGSMGYKVEKLDILPLGGYMYLDQLMELQPQAEARIALAGPLANLVTAAMVIAFSRPQESVFLGLFLRANLTLMAFNLLPALPLDGGRVLRARLTAYLSFYRATRTVIVTGSICGCLLLGLGGYLASLGQINPTVFAAGAFLLYNAYEERKRLLIPLIRYALGRKRSLQGATLLPALTLVAAPGAKVNEVLKHIRPQKYYQVSVLDEEYKLIGILTEHQVLDAIIAGAGGRRLQDVAKRKDG
ncbi:MAG: site-2 protease family protein [Bacillota bacterium]|jgi:stage IV sporulation protein FB